MSAPTHDEQFVAFVNARQAGLQRLALLLCGDVHRAQDLVQEALIKAYRHWGQVSDAGSPEAYVRTIVVREFLSWRRRRSSGEVPTETLPDRSAAGDTGDAVVLTDLVNRALAGLTPRQRAVVVLKYYEDLSDDEIGRRLGYRTGSVRTVASRALQELRPQIAIEGER